MAQHPLAIIPLKGFDEAKGRLELPPEARSVLARVVAERVIMACGAGGLEPLVITGSESIRRWATGLAAACLDEPPEGGLNAAAASGATEAGRIGAPWLVVHGDLPLLDAEDLGALLAPLNEGGVVIAPSRDGGTNLLGSTGPFEFRYGPGSFHRHLAVLGERRPHTVVTVGTAVEVDTLPDLRAAARLPEGAWLRRFLS